MSKNHLSRTLILKILKFFELENRRLSNRNQKIEIGIAEAEIGIEAIQLTRTIVTALGSVQYINHTLNPKILRPHVRKLLIFRQIMK